jgi:hypothetical protein
MRGRPSERGAPGTVSDETPYDADGDVVELTA